MRAEDDADVGVSNDLKERAMEYSHHGDPLIPANNGLANTRVRS
jgi:hypothetical protein